MALLHLMARVDDTNIVHRAGPAALQSIRERIGEVLAGESDTGRLLRFAGELDRELIDRSLSPGAARTCWPSPI